jgi:hypothetical protein
MPHSIVSRLIRSQSLLPVQHTAPQASAPLPAVPPVPPVPPPPPATPSRDSPLPPATERPPAQAVLPAPSIAPSAVDVGKIAAESVTERLQPATPAASLAAQASPASAPPTAATPSVSAIDGRQEAEGPKSTVHRRGASSLARRTVPMPDRKSRHLTDVERRCELSANC